MVTGTKYISSMLNYLLGKINKRTQLTTTYTANAYVTEEAFNRIKVDERNGVICIYGNLLVTSPVPASASSFIEIGKITGYRATQNVLISVPFQNGTGTICVQINSSSGTIAIANTTGSQVGSSSGAWARFQATAIRP